jgi:hypothetical protein
MLVRQPVPPHLHILAAIPHVLVVGGAGQYC